MGSKRDYTSLSYSDAEDTPPQPSHKRQRNQTSSKSKQQQEPKTDLTYGQRCVFPGLDEGTAPVDDDIDPEDETDALAYLRSVRTEASSIPHLLVAPKAGPQLPLHLEQAGDGVDRSIYQSGLGDSRGYYCDGAYTAAPDAEYSDGEVEYGEVDDQASSRAYNKGTSTDSKLGDAYFSALMAQFITLRTRLHKNPPSAVVEALPKNHETEVGFFGTKSHTFKKWTHHLRYTDPLPAQVAAMDRQSTLRLLRIVLGGKFLRRGIELRERTSRWIWALLARLPDRGELDHVEVGWVRELGKRAVLMMVSLAQMAALREEVEGDLDGERLGGDESGPDEEFLGEMEADGEEGDSWPESNASKRAEVIGQDADADIAKPAPENDATPKGKPAEGDGGEDGEADMDLDMEDGEVPDEPTAAPEDQDADIAAVKARLLAQLDHVEVQNDAPLSPELKTRRPVQDIDASDGEPFDSARARVNMRATLNMILTVAGEFYGQRDLLEFRDPFTGL